jgi:hypothetical protein
MQCKNSDLSFKAVVLDRKVLLNMALAQLDRIYAGGLPYSMQVLIGIPLYIWLNRQKACSVLNKQALSVHQPWFPRCLYNSNLNKVLIDEQKRETAFRSG